MINERPVRPAIVVGVDGSISALHATRWAAREAALRRLVVRDKPVRGLLETAEHTGAQLIVVGARGLNEAFTTMGLGSTSRALLHQTECPIAIVRPDSRERTDR